MYNHLYDLEKIIFSPPEACVINTMLTKFVFFYRLEQELFEKPKYFRPMAKPPVKSSWGGFNPGTIIAILVALLAALYVSAALMMLRIDKLHSAYVNHPLATPERFTQDRLLQYLNTNLDQIVKVKISQIMLRAPTKKSLVA